MEITSEIVTKLKAEHPTAELHRLTHEGGHVVVRTPTTGEAQQFLDQLADSETKGVAVRNLVWNCVVWPPEREFMLLLTQRPFLGQSIGNELVEIYGLKKIADRKKL